MSQDMLAALGTWGPIVLMIVIFYFLLYRPQKIEHKKRAKMLESLKRGDEVVTIGGIYGKITEVQEKKLRLKIANNVEIDVVRASINAKVTEEDA